MTIVDGVTPERVCLPLTSSEVADFLKAASIDGQNVVPAGGGTALQIGNPVERIDVLLDTSSLAGVIDYKPTDLMVSVRAGTTIAALNAELAAFGQELPLDIAFPDRASVGGVVATAFAGPRRFASGTLKDLMVGCEYVRGDGLIAKAGGMVVKNVSGFEIPRLLHGSWGTLAVLTSANFKVTPVAKGDLTCSVRFSSWAEAVQAGNRTLTSGVSIVSCEIATVDECGQVVIGARPRDLEAMLTHIESLPAGLVQETCASPGTGTVRIRFIPELISPGDFWATITPRQTMPGLAMMVEFAPVEWKRGLDVWGAAPAGIEIMRAVKRQFDPAGVLNRGRMMI